MKRIIVCLLLLGTLFMVFCQKARSEIYLVSVGIADYQGTENDLHLPVKDAEAVIRLYNQNSQAHSVLLTNEEATVENIIHQMDLQFAKANKNDIVILFFSGHGSKGSFVAYDGFLTYERIREAMSRSSCKNKMIFADACFSGKMRQNGHADHNSLNIMLFLSSRDNETSIESPTMKNGFFTSCLVRCLKGGADTDKNRVITAKELFEGVSEGVKRLSRDKQHPVMWGNFDDNMPVMKW